MVEGHASMPAKRQRTTQAPIRQPIGQYHHNPLFDDRSDASPTSDSLNEASSSASLAFAMDMDNSYGQNYPTAVENQYASNEPQHNQLAHEASNVQVTVDYPHRVNYNTHKDNNINYLTGPMVTRVRPDGTPVDERVLLPRDDDREAMTIGKAKLPTVEQITRELTAEPSSTGGLRRSPIIYTSTSYRTSERKH